MSHRYGDVMAFPTASFAVKRVSDAFRDTPNYRDEFELCLIGSINIESGVATYCAPTRIDWDNPNPNVSVLS